MKKTLFLLSAASILFASSVCASWRHANNGAIPPNAWRAGYDSNGQSLYLCRAIYMGSLTPGKIRPGFSGCNISYAGYEHTVPQYEVFTRSRHAKGGYWHWTRFDIPRRAWRIGRDSNGTPLYLCRARHENSLIIGKTWRGLNGCDVPYAGHEYTVPRYQVFMLN